MHDTLIPNVKGNIDTKGNICSGWIFHENYGVLPISIVIKSTGKSLLISAEERKDVAEFYKRSDIVRCGWRIPYIPKDIIVIQILVNNEWQSVFEIDNRMYQPSFKKHVPSFVVVDNFYDNPEQVREFALQQSFMEHKAYHKGKRTDGCYRFSGLKERFEEILNVKITNWEKYGTNGCFQYCIAGEQLVYHIDSQTYAGLIYLTPNAPPNTGTTFYRSKWTKTMKPSGNEYDLVFKNGYLDCNEFELVDQVGNVYNRLVLFDAKFIHAATEYFGTNIQNARLFQLFFFDIE